MHRYQYDPYYIPQHETPNFYPSERRGESFIRPQPLPKHIAPRIDIPALSAVLVHLADEGFLKKRHVKVIMRTIERKLTADAGKVFGHVR